MLEGNLWHLDIYSVNYSPSGGGTGVGGGKLWRYKQNNLCRNQHGTHSHHVLENRQRVEQSLGTQTVCFLLLQDVNDTFQVPIKVRNSLETNHVLHRIQ